MSSLYFWGKPITSHLFTNNHTPHSEAQFHLPIQTAACGEKHCVLIAEGRPYGLGDNNEGQLGQQCGNQQSIIPLQYPSNRRVKQVACGWRHTLLLDDSGIVYSAGSGEHGELGRGRCGSASFGEVLGRCRQVSAGKDHSLALCGSKVMGWGNCREGQLGLLSRKVYHYPQELNVYPTSLVFAGAKYSLFVTSKGVFGTGYNQDCQLGLGHQTDVQVPRRLAIDEQIVTVCGGNYCAAQTKNGEWFLWGSGVLGVFKFPTKMSFLNGAEWLVMGLNFGLFGREGGIWVWGSNRWGELGQGEEVRDFAVEVQEMSDLNLTAIAAGGNFVIGFKSQSAGCSLSNSVKGSLSDHNQQENSSISKQLFKQFKRSSGSENRFGDSFSDKKQQAWARFYQIPHSYDEIECKPFIPQQKPQKQAARIQTNPAENEGYNTWYCGKPRKVKLTESLKILTYYNSNLSKENKTLEKELQVEPAQKQKSRAEHAAFVNMNEDNRSLSKVLKLQEKIHGHKEGQSNEGLSFSKKLRSLKALLESAL